MKKLTIKEIKETLKTIDDEKDPLLLQLKNDERKGVQTALKQWQKRQEAKQALKERFTRMNRYENEARRAGYLNIAGIDEVGRGPLAGPVVSAAVLLDPKRPILGLNDSKKLSLKQRTELFAEINEKALAVGLGIGTSAEIDQYNILEATKLSMNKAILDLAISPDFLLIDAETIETPLPQKAVIKGDLNSNSIAAASIVAKVTRDLMMEEYEDEYPGYGFSSNVGYGTKEHIKGLETLGATPIHRKSFAPVKNNLK
jgi:ribonuclease HII